MYNLEVYISDIVKVILFYIFQMLQRGLMQRLIDLPKSVEGLMAKDVYEKARAYALDRNSFGIVQDIYSKIFNTVRIIKNILIHCVLLVII